MNELIRHQINSMNSFHSLVIGSYTAGNVQRAMRSALARFQPRIVRGKSAKRSQGCFDVKADGTRVEL